MIAYQNIPWNMVEGKLNRTRYFPDNSSTYTLHHYTTSSLISNCSANEVSNKRCAFNKKY